MASKRIPSYRLHKPSGQAVVTLSGRDVYLGIHGTAGSKQEYDRVIAEWLASNRAPAIVPDQRGGATVNEVVAQYLAWAEGRWSGKRNNSHLQRVKQAIKDIVERYGSKPADEFRGRAVFALRSLWVSRGWNETYVNHHVAVVRQIWKWLSAREIVSAEIAYSIRAVPPIKPREEGVRPAGKVTSVDRERVTKTIVKMSKLHRDMVEVQLATGMRPGELVRLRKSEIEIVRNEKHGVAVGIYQPSQHKTDYRGHKRKVYLLPDVMARIQGYLDAIGDSSNDYVFSPSREVAKKTIRSGNPNWRPKDHYEVTSYTRLINRACIRAGVEPWHPHQLRHTAATEIANQLDAHIAKQVLGHQQIATTEIYIDDDDKTVIEALLNRSKTPPKNS